MLYEPLPCKPGSSPFHVKGLAYRGFFAYAERRIPGGMAKVLSHFADAELRVFFKQPFLAGTLYDVLPVMPLVSVMAHLERLSIEEFTRRSARSQALYDVKGVYRRYVDGRSLSEFVLRIPKFIMQYSDFGVTDLIECNEQGALFVRTGVPLYIVPWFLPMNESYMETVLAFVGSFRPKAKGQVGSMGDAREKSIATVSLRIRVSY